MSKTKNTHERSAQIQEVAQSLINQIYHDSLPLAASKPIRTVWQHQLMEKTGCTPFTARSHVAKALCLARGKMVAAWKQQAESS